MADADDGFSDSDDELFMEPFRPNVSADKDNREPNEMEGNYEI